MSEEESEKEANEEGENEENENEDNENEEGENEEGENEENENEEEEDDNKKKKKGKKNKEEKKEIEKVSKDKLIETNEVKMDANNNNEINFTMGNISSSDRQKTISEILYEVNYEMDFLSKQIDHHFINLNYPKFSYSNFNNYNNYNNKENESFQNLLMRAKELTTIIDNENLKDNNYVKNNIYDDILNQGMEIQNNFNNYQNRNNNIFPYDPNRNKEYYSSLNSNNNNYSNNNFNNNNLLNNNFNNNNNNNNNLHLNSNPNQNLHSRNLNNNIPLSSNQNNHTVSTNFYNTSRIRRMDELYRTNRNNNPNRKPIIYSQMGNPQNINIPLKNTQEDFKNKNNLISNQNNFERYKPGSISQAMNILLDKE